MLGAIMIDGYSEAKSSVAIGSWLELGFGFGFGFRFGFGFEFGSGLGLGVAMGAL